MKGFHAVISRLPVFWHLSLPVPSPSCSPSLPPFLHWCLSFTEIRGCPSVCVCGCAHLCCLQAWVPYYFFYLCVFSCVHTLPVEHALSRTWIDWGLDRQGKEVGVGIDKEVNEVIGRINGVPKGTMSISACRSVSLSVQRVECYGRQRQSVTHSEWVHKQNVIHNRAGHGLCCCSLPHPSIWQDNGTVWHNTEHWLPLWGQSGDWDTVHVLELIIRHSFLQSSFILTTLFCILSALFIYIHVLQIMWMEWQKFWNCSWRMSSPIQDLKLNITTKSNKYFSHYLYGFI